MLSCKKKLLKMHQCGHRMCLLALEKLLSGYSSDLPQPFGSQPGSARAGSQTRIPSHCTLYHRGRCSWAGKLGLAPAVLLSWFRSAQDPPFYSTALAPLSHTTSVSFYIPTMLLDHHSLYGKCHVHQPEEAAACTCHQDKKQIKDVWKISILLQKTPS